MLKENSFSHDGRNLAVRVAQQDNQFLVRVFEGNKPVTGVVYSVTIETALDGQMRGYDLGVLDELMDIAESDVTEGRVPLLPSN